MAQKNENMENITFEAALSRLEEIVRMLEGGDAPLDMSLQVFEEGISLVKICNSKLEAAEQKIKILTETPDGNVVEGKFEPSELKG